jgi:hypothetical protein
MKNRTGVIPTVAAIQLAVILLVAAVSSVRAQAPFVPGSNASVNALGITAVGMIQHGIASLPNNRSFLAL